MTMPPRISCQRGVLLLEALIAILIFSMGILALVGLQAASINSVVEAKYRVDASFYANRIISEMWVDRPNLASYACAPCTTSNGNDKTRQWVTAIQDDASIGLPGVTNAGNQPTIAVAGSTVRVTVKWKAPRATDTRNHVAVAYISGP